MKKVLSTLIILAIMVSFMTMPSVAQKSESVTLTLWSPASESDAFGPAYAKAILDFESVHPGVKINHKTFGYDSYKTKIKTAVAANKLPDIFFSWGGSFSKPLVESGNILPLDKYYTGKYKEQLPRVALTYTTYKGKIYGSTYTTSISALFYNKKIFKTNGLKAPSTYDELITVSKKLLNKKITPMAMSVKDGWVLAMTHDALTLKSAGSQRVMSALLNEGQSYNHTDFFASARKFKQLVGMGVFNKNADRLSYDGASELFTSGKVAMFTIGSWMAGSIQSNAKNPADFDVVPYPAVGSKSKATDFVGGPIDSIMVSRLTSNPDIAAKAAFELTRSISKYAYLDGVGLAVWKKDYNDSKVNPITRKLAQLTTNATSYTLWFDTLTQPEEAGEYIVLLQKLYKGSVTPEKFVKSMADVLKK